MALSTADAARLAELRAQLAAALDPNRATKVTSGGRSVERATPDIKALERQIDALEAADATASGRVRRRGALTFRWRR